MRFMLTAVGTNNQRGCSQTESTAISLVPRLSLYLRTEFKAVQLLLSKVMAGLNPVVYQTLQYWHGASAIPQNVFYHKEMV